MLAGIHMRNREQVRKYQTLSGNLAREVTVRMTAKGRPFDVFTSKFAPPEIPGVTWRTCYEARRTNPDLVYADNPKLAYEWLWRNGHRID